MVPLPRLPVFVVLPSEDLVEQLQIPVETEKQYVPVNAPTIQEATGNKTLETKVITSLEFALFKASMIEMLTFSRETIAKAYDSHQILLNELNDRVVMSPVGNNQEMMKITETLLGGLDDL